MKNVIIVGGGFSGIMTAVNLVDTLEASSARVTVLEAEPRLGGLAYGERNGDEHLMNTHIRTLSAFPGRPLHLSEWLNSADRTSWPERWRGARFGPDDFCPRKLYGLYLNGLFDSRAALAARESNRPFK